MHARYSSCQVKRGLIVGESSVDAVDVDHRTVQESFGTAIYQILPSRPLVRDLITTLRTILW